MQGQIIREKYFVKIIRVIFETNNFFEDFQIFS